MQKEFTKADLKDGMVVEQNNEERYLVMGDRLLWLSGYNPLTQFNDDLTNILGEKYHIKRVFKVKSKYVYNLREIFGDENLELIWERDARKHMTVEEMRQKLEELTGEKFEIEPSREEMVGVCYEYCRNYPVMFCKDCPLREVENCNFEELTNEELKECYEKVIANGKKRCVCCGEIIPEGRMVCPLCQEKTNERLKVGDTIKCSTSKEMVDLMMLLAKEGTETDFLYEKDGEHGLWLEIVEVMEDGRKES